MGMGTLQVTELLPIPILIIPMIETHTGYPYLCISLVTGTHTATSTTLQAAAPCISSILLHALQLTKENPLPPTRANIRWSKISINSIPTSVSNTWAPYTLEECHKALVATNPAYASLSIMQLPSWVCPLTSYQSRSVSSLSVAFEDQDGSMLKMLLDKQYLYCFGNRASVKKWKQCQKLSKDTASQQVGQHTQGCNMQDSNDNQDIVIQLMQEPPPLPLPATVPIFRAGQCKDLEDYLEQTGLTLSQYSTIHQMQIPQSTTSPPNQAGSPLSPSSSVPPCNTKGKRMLQQCG
jgi:hypothetical protein